ncbi:MULTISPECIES: GntR family transcriptional regulator [Pseudomonas]|uniref:GntR family transcriptional regulator n=1 Tax=Pseudomonas TaxID=286 RepID=UPI00059DA30B|nr:MULTISPECIES: GntR family transcriptional regulator [Pseudomonas]AMT90896.1 GntR family transcriptional regulator [Pseudomonas koreensis]MBB4058312.1 DNA-binding GntR family transcriptional regulator [Pseudomonas koreensis]TSB52933.1 GntR family transcriptional regulator [Pseudomonas sp. ef1]
MNSFASASHAQSTALPVSRLGTPTEDLYPRVFDAILEQRIDEDSRFTEDSLQAMFGAGRADVRRVLTQLSHEQIVVLRANHRPRVAAPDRELIRQTLHARRLAENTLVRLACQRPQPDDLKCLRTLIEREKRAIEQDRRGAAIRLSGEFHLQLARMAGNLPLAHFLRSLVPLTSLAIARSRCPTRSCCAWQEHLALVEVVERGDAAKAEGLMNRHLDHLEQTLLGSDLEHCAVG